MGAVAGNLRGLAGRGDVDEVGLGEVLENPLAALAKDLWVRVECFDLLTWNGSHEAVFDAKEDLCTDPERGFDKKIEGVGDSAFRGVFDRNDSVRSLAAGDLVEDFGEVRKWLVIDRVAEFFDRRLVCPSPFWSEVGDF